MAPTAVGIVGLATTAVIAAIGGVTTGDALLLLLYSAVGATAAGLVAAVVLRTSRHRTITAQAIVAALAPVLATAIGVTWAASEMFLMVHDLVALGIVLAAAGTVAVIIALFLGRRVASASEEVAGLARRLGDSSATPSAQPPASGPVELVELARELETTSARLREARERAEATELSRRELVAWVSHDLRTPLAGIRAMVEAIEDGVVDDEATIARYHATIRVETERLAGLVDDLFELSRIQAGALRLDTERVPLDELITDAVEACGVATPSVELVTRSSRPAPIVEMSVPEIVRVLRNLVDNAVRHTPDGGQVVVEAGSEDDNAWISVSDGCGGISETDLPRVFEMGYRGDMARTPGDGRGGLGLAVARGLVDAHGGRIEVANVDPGCRFTVRLPTSGRRPLLAGELPPSIDHRPEDGRPGRRERLPAGREPPNRMSSSTQPRGSPPGEAEVSPTR